MEVAVEIVKAFEEEKQRFLKEMKTTLSNYQIVMEKKEQLYENLLVISTSIDLRKMQVESRRKEKPIEIKNKDDLLMAVAWYSDKVRNVFIKQFKSFEDPFKKVIEEHEEKVFTILKSYI